ncbi:HugZ family protein [Thalassospira sp.]|uniref:HugZ family pyridoxamine 5'-phosphate oxidase n=1 Tax=Thalassospira sp. TaxID=1912094 RepID=UPI00273754BD|nr:DUF2470 domain-containing protein [Thalassospira sp.]MDP2700261.1 DUF2470 domain-containing protein [Thalassospira sp.]
MTDTPDIPGNDAHSLRNLMRHCRYAALATLSDAAAQAGPGWPSTSMVVPACDCDGTPVLLMSGLADHSRHLHNDPRLSLLYVAAGTGTAAPDTASARLTVYGTAHRDASPDLRARYLAAHPAAALYAGFGDFAFYRVAISEIYWVGGFGKQRRLPGAKFLAAGVDALRDARPHIIDHMNADHRDALADIARYFGKLDADRGWIMADIDCDGMLITDQETVQRIDFAKTIDSPAAARQILVEMCQKARISMA